MKMTRRDLAVVGLATRGNAEHSTANVAGRPKHENTMDARLSRYGAETLERVVSMYENHTNYRAIARITKVSRANVKAHLKDIGIWRGLGGPRVRVDKDRVYKLLDMGVPKQEIAARVGCGDDYVRRLQKAAMKRTPTCR